MKFSPLSIVSSRKGFHVNMVFFFFFIFYYCVIKFNNFYLVKLREIRFNSFTLNCVDIICFDLNKS